MHCNPKNIRYISKEESEKGISSEDEMIEKKGQLQGRREINKLNQNFRKTMPIKKIPIMTTDNEEIQTFNRSKGRFDFF